MYTIEEFDKEKTKVLKYIIYKKRSEQEVRAKFKNSIEENLLEDIIQYLKEAKYIDDTEYIEKTVQDFMSLKNLSLKELKYKLIAKGLNKNIIEDYFYNNEEDIEQYEINSARNIVIKKSNLMEQDEIEQYLFKKGYKKESIKLAIEEIN